MPITDLVTLYDECTKVAKKKGSTTADFQQLVQRCHKDLVASDNGRKVLLTFDGMLLNCLPVGGDLSLVKVAVIQNGLALKYASRTLRSDPELVLIAVRNAPAAYEHVLLPASSDPRVVEVVLNQRPDLVRKLSGDILNDLACAKMLIERQPARYLEVSSDIQKNLTIALLAVKLDPAMMMFVAHDLLQHPINMFKFFHASKSIMLHNFYNKHLLLVELDIQNLRIAVGQGAIFLEDLPSNTAFNAAMAEHRDRKIVAVEEILESRQGMPEGGADSVKQFSSGLAFFRMLSGHERAKCESPVINSIRDSLIEMHSSASPGQ